MKVIFLDIDGVLNRAATKQRVDGYYMGVDPVLARRLAGVVRQTNAVIVLTSTWKKDWYKNDWEKYRQDAFADHLDAALGRCGLDVFDKTEDDVLDRGAGILRWMAGRRVEAFVVLDDALFDYERCGLLPRLIRTENAAGLTAEKAAAAVGMLGAVPRKA